MFHIVFYHPEIPGNTGNAVRMVACAGATLHLVEPLGFDLEDAKLRRAGLDYHDLAVLRVHPNLHAAWEAIRPERVIAFTVSAERRYDTVDYHPGDVLLFGPESVGLPADVLDAGQVSTQVRIPMVPGPRSMNVANSAAIATFEAWRQQGFATP
ncbi:tRNA (uridine(34)/cytosine(34)/5-carboxymethylaminomethyluridine(34)-2'-O)-methyltransferase TrmL [Allosaccharopolyspora coralli]|uniref:Putative tRNA (cytidine(34)-2'-O)-methyltransferase n=1 Tax=Allosaccharopolyspora coralli TaxID=2665642 RepID=A0A5Q3QDW6_9PSEU|nr:tRNA (cytidine(34)-2'-O)-methyltransferase [Allosaccharopolyspora coralli]QGK69689.1 tRNA (uridine(34)/cytosine(34)/5-carboxymethylaminomethyluridine(34)-2'-O)-methyltransferase TrmL [Allosaccharopolyspora coralli]